MTEPHDRFLQEYPDLFDYIYRYVRVRIDDEDACKDLVSDIFLKALKKLKQYQADKGSLKQWLTGIAKHQLINYWTRRRLTLPLEEFDLGTIPQFDQLAFDQLIERLPAQIRQLLIWRYVDDLTYEQIASLMHKSPAALRQYFSRLHKQLRILYADI